MNTDRPMHCIALVPATVYRRSFAHLLRHPNVQSIPHWRIAWLAVGNCSVIETLCSTLFSWHNELIRYHSIRSLNHRMHRQLNLSSFSVPQSRSSRSSRNDSICHSVFSSVFISLCFAVRVLSLVGNGNSMRLPSQTRTVIDS